MTIDNPIHAAEALVESDERQRSPVTERLAAILEPVSDLLPIPAGSVLGAIQRYLGLRRQENLAYLADVTRDEVKKLRNKVESLSEEHKRFIEREFPTLCMDAFNKAENVRGKERIERLGKILGHAFEKGPALHADETEEMMRVAVNLNDEDMIVLEQIASVQSRILTTNSGRPMMDEVNDAWRNYPPTLPDKSEGDLVSICSKLESFGLVTRVERNTSKLPPNKTPFGILPKGVRFLDYLKGA